MKKSNVAIFVLLALASAFFLWLWFFLGLNRIDEPLDLVLSIVWWIVIAAAVAIIVKMERTRRQRVRTVYVGDNATFNSEKGLMPRGEDAPLPEAIASILRDLQYDFTRVDFPDEEDFKARYFVRTRKFDVDEPKDDGASEAVGQEGDRQDASQQWTGEVFVVETKEERPFETPEELALILASLDQAA